MSPSFVLLDPHRPSPAFRHRCALTVMAKAPVAGQVKTRLSPPLTPQQAAGLNACFLKDTVGSLTEAANTTGDRWVISYTPEGAEAAFEGILPSGALLLPQHGEGFGERLRRTAEDLFACGFSSVCLIDSDSPTVPASVYAHAAEELQNPADRVILGASEDGGYYLIGMKKAHPRLFEEITWSTETVARQTRERAAQLRLPVISLPVWYDVDEAESLRRLERELFSDQTQSWPQSWPEQSAAGKSEKGSQNTAPRNPALLPYPAPFTHAYLKQIGLSLNGSAAENENQADAARVDGRAKAKIV